MISYTVVQSAVRGESTMILDQTTSDALDTGDSDASAVEREIRRDAEQLAASLGRRINVEAANGISLSHLAADVTV